MPDVLGYVRTGVLVGVDATRRGVDVALALPRIAIALERLAGSTEDLRRLADTSDELRRVLRSASGEDVIQARETLQRVADAVTQLNLAVASLNTTVSPLQGTAERLGRFVDRLPQRSRRILDVDSDATEPAEPAE